MILSEIINYYFLNYYRKKFKFNKDVRRSNFKILRFHPARILHYVEERRSIRFIHTDQFIIHFVRATRLPPLISMRLPDDQRNDVA